jgi:hypothetical protein
MSDVRFALEMPFRFQHRLPVPLGNPIGGPEGLLRLISERPEEQLLDLCAVRHPAVVCTRAGAAGPCSSQDG